MPTIQKLWFADERIFIETSKGEISSQSMRFFPRLRQATETQRFEWTASHFGLHWKHIDEDIISIALHGTTTTR
jgi:hypothetical protein